MQTYSNCEYKRNVENGIALNVESIGIIYVQTRNHDIAEKAYKRNEKL